MHQPVCALLGETMPLTGGVVPVRPPTVLTWIGPTKAEGIAEVERGSLNAAKTAPCPGYVAGQL